MNWKTVIIIIIILIIGFLSLGVAWLSIFLPVNGRAPFPSFDIPVDGAFCVSNGTANEITIIIKSTGTSTIWTDDFALVQVDGIEVDAFSTGRRTTWIAPGESDILVSGHDCFNGTTGCSSGYHTIYVGWESFGKHKSVYCP